MLCTLQIMFKLCSGKTKFPIQKHVTHLVDLLLLPGHILGVQQGACQHCLNASFYFILYKKNLSEMLHYPHKK